MLRFLPTIASSGTVQAKSQRNSPAELWAIILSVCHQASPRFFHYLDRLQQPTKSVIGQSYSNGNTAPCLRACVRASPAPSHRFRAACAWCRCWHIPSPLLLLVLAGAPHCSPLAPGRLRARSRTPPAAADCPQHLRLISAAGPPWSAPPPRARRPPTSSVRGSAHAAQAGSGARLVEAQQGPARRCRGGK